MDQDVLDRLVGQAAALRWGPTTERLSELAAEPEMREVLDALLSRTTAVDMKALFDALRSRGYSDMEISTLSAVAV